MSEIKRGFNSFSDSMDKIHETSDGIQCCGKKLKLTAHMDGRYFYGQTYQCECGNIIQRYCRRSGEDALRGGDDNEEE